MIHNLGLPASALSQVSTSETALRCLYNEERELARNRTGLDLEVPSCSLFGAVTEYIHEPCCRSFRHRRIERIEFKQLQN